MSGDRTRKTSVPLMDRPKYGRKHRSRSLAEVRQARAREHWLRVHSYMQSASAAFSAAGQERRKAFTQRKWHTVGDTRADDSQRLSLPFPELCPSSGSMDVFPPSPHFGGLSPFTQRSKTVSFEDDHSHPGRQYRYDAIGGVISSWLVRTSIVCYVNRQ